MLNVQYIGGGLISSIENRYQTGVNDSVIYHKFTTISKQLTWIYNNGKTAKKIC